MTAVDTKSSSVGTEVGHRTAMLRRNVIGQPNPSAPTKFPSDNFVREHTAVVLTSLTWIYSSRVPPLSSPWQDGGIGSATQPTTPPSASKLLSARTRRRQP